MQVLEEGYKALLLEARLLECELDQLKHDHVTLADKDTMQNLKDISAGRVSTAIKTGSIVAVREMAREIEETPTKCLELLIEDFESVVQWGLAQNPPLSRDAIRERIVKRKTLMEAALPEAMERHSDAALKEIERRYLERNYVNDETMLGDKIEDIPQENFFVSEDNYAWNMEELANAIAANSGVMRNPLSKLLFSETDIKTILAHPLGDRLRRYRDEQSKHKKGVRPETIAEVAKLGKIMLEDQTTNAAPSHVAMDEFLAFVLTLPDREQQTIGALKVPARDSNTRQAYDYTILESVKDAKGGMTCGHKVSLLSHIPTQVIDISTCYILTMCLQVGDFLTQAAAYLRTLK
jgi:hypothetical protein